MSYRLLILTGWLDKSGRLALHLAALLGLALVLLTTQQVAARYLFASSSIALQELQLHLFGAMFLLAGAAAYRDDEHVRVDVFSSRWQEKHKAYIELIGVLGFLVPMCLVMILYGSEFVLQARSYGTTGEGISGWLLAGERSPDPGGLPAKWIVKSLIPLGASLLLLQGLAQGMRAVATITTREPRR
jgi:TRAP-type mannitol/chloroaromatic compound transport system permease small subunit